ncbi:hypothetical protein D3C75_1376620 [compost metagenome]
MITTFIVYVGRETVELFSFDVDVSRRLFYVGHFQGLYNRYFWSDGTSEPK